MTANERFQRDGVIKFISPERFNRDKGTEYCFRPRDIDGKRMVVGYLGAYPDAPESHFSGDGIMAPYEQFCAAWDAAEAESSRGISRRAWSNLILAGAESFSMDRYRIIIATGMGLPVCEKCHQTIL